MTLLHFEYEMSLESAQQHCQLLIVIVYCHLLTVIASQRKYCCLQMP